MKRTLSIILSFAVLFSTVSGFSAVPAKAATEVTYDARAVLGGLGGTELFLGGKYIELGISNWGDFGTEGSMPSNFRGTDVRTNLGMSADHDGFGQGLDLPIDYYLPGAREERFAVGYKVGSTTYARSNSAIEGPKSMPTLVTNESNISNGLLQARIVSTWAGKMEITQIIRFGEYDKIYKNDVTIKNISTEDWDSARYMRSMDPDNTVDQGGEYKTANTVTHTYAQDGFAVVKAETVDALGKIDPLFEAFGSRVPIFFFSDDPAAKASIFGFANVDPYASAAYDNPSAKGVTIEADRGITITWDSGPLGIGHSKSFTYYTSLDERPFDEVLQDIISNNGIVETKENNGTVAGKHRVVSKGYTFKDPIDLNEIEINNLPAGITYTVDRVGDQLLEFTFSGQALLHSSENSTNDASVTIKKANFVDSPSDVTYRPFDIIYHDNPRIYIDQEYVVADEDNEFGAEDYVILRIKDATFANAVRNDQVIIDNLLPGMTYNVTRLSKTELRITFSGESTVVSDSNHAYVTIATDAIIGTISNPTSNSFKIDLGVKEPYLQVTPPLIYEDGDSSTITSEIVVSLVNGTFAEMVDLGALHAINLPTGLVVSRIERVSNTQLKVFLGGAAVSSNAADSVSNVMFTMNPYSILPTEAHSVMESVYEAVYSNTYSIIFRDSYISLKVKESQITDDPVDGTVKETLTVTLNNGTFAGDITDGVIVNNLPEGLDFTVERISDTELKISFTGVPTKRNPVFAYTSVTVKPSAIVDAVKPLTSDTFELIAPSDLEVVAASIQDGKLKVVFNKNVDPDSVNLDGLKLGGAVVQAPFEIKGNELLVKLPASYTDNVITFDEGAITAAGNRNNAIKRSVTGIDLGEAKSYINPKGKVQDSNLNLLDRKGESIELKPAFSADQSAGYSANVPNEVSRFQVSTLPTEPVNTVMKVTLNGVAVDIERLEDLALKVGKNVVLISIYDEEHPVILLGQYELVITRKGAQDIEGEKESIVVDVKDTGNSNQGVVSKTTIERVKLQDGTKKDNVTIPVDLAQRTIDAILGAGSNSASFIIPDVKDEVSEVDLNIPNESRKLFADAAVELGIVTDNLKVIIPSTSLEGFDEDLYFKFIPIKKEEEKQEVINRAMDEAIVKVVIGNNELSVVGRPMTIETNLQSRPVTLIMPLGDVNLSEEELQDLAIYIEHSDGTKELIRGRLVAFNENGELGLEFSVSKFSTFTLVHGAGLADALGGALDEALDEASEHLSYIKGYPDGTFRPENSITRAEMATILSKVIDRSLGNVYSTYSDVVATHWASASIENVTQMGLMSGYPDGSFAPDKSITRAEMASLISRLVDDSVTSGAGFSDITGSWATAAILKAQGAGFIGGYSDGSFKPNRTLTRAEAVTIINKVLGRGPIHELTRSIIFSDVSASHWALLNIAEASMDHSFDRAENGVEQWMDR